MRRLVLRAGAFFLVAFVTAARAGAQTETFVTGAGAGLFPPDAIYLGIPVKGLELGMGLGVADTWGAGQFQTTLSGVSALGQEQNIIVEGLVSSSVPSEANTAIASGSCTVDPGDGTPPLAGVPFTIAVAANPDGTGTLALTLGATSLPAAAINEGYVTIQQP